MDWVFYGGSAASLDAATSSLSEHLHRHADEVHDAETAARLVEGTLQSVGATSGLLWAHLDWEMAQPVLTLNDLGNRPPVIDRWALLQEGLWSPDEELSDLVAPPGRPLARISLPVTRPPELAVELPSSAPGRSAGPGGLTASVAATLVAQIEMGATVLEATSAAGAAMADAALAAFAESHENRLPASALEVARAFAEFQNASGADFFVLEGSDRRAVLVNRTCPFGSSVLGRRTLCRVTSAMLGSLGSRTNGNVEVVLDEAIAAGDHRCRAVVNFDPTWSRWAHTYRQAPAGTAGGSHRSDAGTGFRVGLSIQLPRDQLSVPLIRHLVGHAMREVGVIAEDISDVELAVTEAAANVIDHSGTSDAYEVSLTIGPVLAELRVVDVGRGFDHESLTSTPAAPHDEQGRGLGLMKALVDQVRFISAPERGTIVHLIKRLRFGSDSALRKMVPGPLESPGGEPAGPGR